MPRRAGSRRAAIWGVARALWLVGAPAAVVVVLIVVEDIRS